MNRKGTTAYTINSTNTTSMDNFYACLKGKMLYVTCTLTNKVTLTDAAYDLFTLNLSTFGISSLNHNFANSAWSDGGNAIIMSRSYTDGVVNSVDTIDGDVSAPQTCYIAYTATVNTFA